MRWVESKFDVWCRENWFAVQTKPRKEHLGETTIAAWGVETFLPLLGPVGRQSAPRPLFPGYLFARFCPFRELDRIRFAQGILRVLCSGNQPIPVPGEIIGSIQSRVEEDGWIRLRREKLEWGTHITITAGPFEGVMGRVEREWDDGRRVMILLDAMQQAKVLVDRGCLAVA